MEAASDPTVRELVGVWASQIGKTDCILNIIGARMCGMPGPMMMIQPTLGMAETWSKDRLSPMARDTPALQGKIEDPRSRTSANTILHKQFPGGHITVSGANSPSSLAQRPIRDLYLDDEDRFPPSAGTEGDPVRLAQTRTRAFWNARVVHISSPGIRGVSRIEVVWGRSDQRYFYVPCHACGVRQTLKWSQVAWDKNPETGEHMPETARYVCEHCGEFWSDLQRRVAVREGIWRATRPFRGVAGFHVNALAAPWESCNLDRLVSQWIEAQGNPSLLQVFVNTVLADWWEESHYSRSIDEQKLLDRREEIPREMPEDAVVLTAGVDVQDRRFEVSVYAWGANEESWLLEHKVLHGDPSTSVAWADLDAYLTAPWPRHDGGKNTYLRGIALDTGGHFTSAAYDFCGPRFRRETADGGRQFLLAIKGMAGSGELWPRAASKITTKVPLWPIRVDAGKEQVYGRLDLDKPGPGYVHLPKTADYDFIRGLTAEKVVTRIDKKGFPKRAWELKLGRTRNEPLDCAVYAYAALSGLRALGFDFETEIGLLRQRQSTRNAVPAQVSAVPPQEEPIRRAPAESGGWLGDTEGWL